MYNALLKECSFVHVLNEKDEFENEVTEAIQCQTVELKKCQWSCIIIAR